MQHEILVNVPTQKLVCYKNNAAAKAFDISTAKNGLGESFGSEKTPRGLHIIRAKIGDKAPINSVFVARRPTGEIYSTELDKQYPNRDWILTRILWLSGLEMGKNRLGHCDTMRRFIYIHGVPDERVFGYPQSHGCIQMHNEDIIELFDMVPVGTKVNIKA